MLTATQCVIYSTTNWNTPHIIELRGTVSLIVQSRDHFAMVDTVNGLQVLNFDGRVLSQPRFQGMRADFLSPLTLGYASDAVALIDPADAKSVRLFDPITAKQTATITHAIEVEAVALSQTKGLRRLALIDKNRDLYLTPTAGASELYKLHVMVDTIRWNDDNGSLCAVAVRCCAAAAYCAAAGSLIARRRPAWSAAVRARSLCSLAGFSRGPLKQSGQAPGGKQYLSLCFGEWW